MKWNIDKIGFLHQPEYFLGSFDNPHMQKRHEQELARNLENLKRTLSEEADPLKALRSLNPRDHIQFLMNNLGEFRNHGELEEAVLELYSKNNGPFSSSGDAGKWQELFELCDPVELQKCGDPPPFSDKTTVYRGTVSGLKRSLAWTPDRKSAEKFAKRWSDPDLGGGTLYEVDVTPKHVLVYFQSRFETTLILVPSFIREAPIRNFST